MKNRRVACNFHFLFVPMLISVLFSGCEKAADVSVKYYECIPAFPDAGNAHPQAKKYQYFLDYQVKRGFPGGVLLIRDSLKKVWIGTSGRVDLSANTPFEKCTKSRISSVTKIFIATVILSLEEEGLLSIEDPVNKWIARSITNHIDNGNEATVRQLLTHTSGIFNYTDNLLLNTIYLNQPDKHATTEELVKFAYNQNAYFPAGKGFEYSNTNYLLLGLIIEAVLHKDVSEVIKERIILKLNLTNTFYDPYSTPPGTAKGYFNQYDNGQLFESTHYDILHFTPDAAIVSNVYDMAVFIESLFEGGLLNNNSLSKMKEIGFINGKQVYGLGLDIWHTPYGTAYGHSGQQLGYQAKLYYFPERKTTVALLVNGSGASLDQYMGHLFSQMPELIFQ